MKTNLVGILSLLVVLVVAGACSLGAEANPEKHVIVPVDDFAGAKHVIKQIEVERGEVLAVILGSNPSTGYSWTENAQVSDAAVMKQAAHEYVAPGQTSEPVVGAAGHERWTFKALDAGTAKITMQYSRPWETGAAEWTFELTVIVK